jgi:hypothetical protein
VIVNYGISGEVHVEASEPKYGMCASRYFSVLNRISEAELESTRIAHEKFDAADRAEELRTLAKHAAEGYVVSILEQLNLHPNTCALQQREKLSVAVGAELNWLDGHPTASIKDYSTRQQKLRELVDSIASGFLEMDYLKRYGSSSASVGLLPHTEEELTKSAKCTAERERSDRTKARYEKYYKRRSHDIEVHKQGTDSRRMVDDRHADGDLQYDASPSTRKLNIIERDALRFQHKSSAEVESQHLPSVTRISSRDHYEHAPRLTGRSDAGDPGITLPVTRPQSDHWEAGRPHDGDTHQPRLLEDTASETSYNSPLDSLTVHVVLAQSVVEDLDMTSQTSSLVDEAYHTAPVDNAQAMDAVSLGEQYESMLRGELDLVPTPTIASEGPAELDIGRPVTLLSAESGIQHILSSSKGPGTVFTEVDFVQIATYLHNMGRPS